jgi:hypothetical protein
MKNEKLTAEIAAMYWGQTCEITAVPDWYHRTLNQIEKVGEIKKLDFGLLHGMFHPNGLAFILHLRPISSLTEADARELYQIERGEKWNTQMWSKDEPLNGPCLDKWWNEHQEWYNDLGSMLLGSPAVWLKLLSWGFDLFGGIESGWAKEVK